MRISKVTISNFRAIEKASIEFQSLTSLIGANNTGKSAVLKAVDLFFSSSPKVVDDDFHKGNTETPIDVTIYFSNFTPDEDALFKTNQIDGELIVTRRLLRGNPKDSGSFFVDAMVNPEFSDCRNEESKKAKRDIYKELQKRFEGLLDVRTADDIDQHLENWEAAHPELLSTQRLGSFRGWKNVAAGQLKKKTDFVFVPAVKEASNETDDARSPVKQLIDALAKQTIENRKDFQEFAQKTNDQLREFTNPDNVPALRDISRSLTNMLQKYYADSNLVATWDPVSEYPVSFPSSHVEVLDHGYQGGVARVGHGLQRAIIIAIVEFLSSSRLKENREQQEAFDRPQSDIIVAIEEPEVYQHPVKQRHICDALSKITEQFNTQTGVRIQVLLATHSPLFVSLPRFHEVRIARRRTVAPHSVCISRLTLSECSAGLAALHRPPKEPMKESSLGAKLHIFTSDMSEGFFGRTVVLVEGVSDKAILEAYLLANDRGAASKGISIIAVGGKKTLDKPAYIFRSLGIPTYILFDNDRSEVENKNKKQKDPEVDYNRFLQRLVGTPNDEIVDWPQGVFATWAAWSGNLETYLQDTCGKDIYFEVREAKRAQFEVSAEDCEKSPTIASAMLSEFMARGIHFENLDKIVDCIDNL